MEAAEYLNQLLSLGDMQNGNFSSEDIAAQKQLIDSLTASIAASDPKPKEVSLEEEGPVPDRVHYEEDSAPTPQEATDQKVQDLMAVAQEYYEPENNPLPRKENYEPGAIEAARAATENLEQEKTETQKLDELVHQSVVDYAKQQGVDYNDLFAHKGASEVAREAVPEVRYKQETRVPTNYTPERANVEYSRQAEEYRNPVSPLPPVAPKKDYSITTGPTLEQAGKTKYEPSAPKKEETKPVEYLSAPGPESKGSSERNRAGMRAQQQFLEDLRSGSNDNYKGMGSPNETGWKPFFGQQETLMKEAAPIPVGGKGKGQGGGGASGGAGSSDKKKVKK